MNFRFTFYHKKITGYNRIIEMIKIATQRSNGIMTASLILHIPHFSQKVVYNINPAVIKSILSSMPQREFIIHARYIRRQVHKLEPGTNRHVMFVRLYQWCRIYYRQRFLVR